MHPGGSPQPASAADPWDGLDCPHPAAGAQATVRSRKAIELSDFKSPSSRRILRWGSSHRYAKPQGVKPESGITSGSDALPRWQTPPCPYPPLEVATAFHDRRRVPAVPNQARHLQSRIPALQTIFFHSRRFPSRSSAMSSNRQECTHRAGGWIVMADPFHSPPRRRCPTYFLYTNDIQINGLKERPGCRHRSLRTA